MCNGPLLSEGDEFRSALLVGPFGFSSVIFVRWKFFVGCSTFGFWQIVHARSFSIYRETKYLGCISDIFFLF